MILQIIECGDSSGTKNKNTHYKCFIKQVRLAILQFKSKVNQLLLTSIEQN